MVKGLLSIDKKVYDKAFTKFKDNIDKWKGSTTLSNRLNEKKKNKAKAKDFFFVDSVLNQYFKGDLKESSIATRKTFAHDGVHYFTLSFEASNVSIKATNFPNDVIGHKVFRWEWSKCWNT